MTIQSKPRHVTFYKSKQGKEPCKEWLQGITDKRILGRVLSRIDKAKHGNFGVHRNLKDGIWELKMDIGGAIRIYFGIENDEIILLLAGGNKRTQQKDIETAKERWQKHTKGD